MKNKKALLIYGQYVTFVKRDHEILKNLDFEVKNLHFKGDKKLGKMLLSFTSQLFFLITKGHKYDVFYIWFADYHAYLPVLFSKIYRKKTILIIGGYDAAKIEEINYGVFCKKKSQVFCARFAIKNSNHILAVDQSLIKGENQYDKKTPTGIKNFVKNIKGNIEVLPTCYDKNVWKPNPKINRLDNHVISVGNAYDLSTFKRKGFDFLKEIAYKMPNVTFTIVGVSGYAYDLLMDNKPKNLNIIGFVNQEELIEEYSKHKVFAQLSLNEGLPNTLCEAMFCGCIPVGSSVNGIPNAVGGSHLIVQKKDIKEAIKVINHALSQTRSKHDFFIKYAKKKYPLELRENRIKDILLS